MITFAFPTKQGAVAPVIDRSTVQIVAVPVEHNADTWSMAGTRGASNWGVSTLLKVSHRENTLLLQEVGSEVIDRRVQALNSLGQTGTGLISIFASGQVSASANSDDFAPEPTSLALLVKTGLCTTKDEHGNPVKVAKTDSVPAAAFTCDKVPLKGNYTSKGGSSIVENGADMVDRATSAARATPAARAAPAGAVPADGATVKNNTVIAGEPFTGRFEVDAVPRETTEAKDLPSSFTSASVFYSACRTVRVELANELMSSRPMAEIRVSDPGHIEWLGLPDKGKITFGSSCGADILSEDANLPSSVDLVNALIASASAFKKAAESK
jgi:hypothetical protein